MGIFDPRQQHSDGAVLSETQALRLGIDLVAQFFGRLPDEAHFFHADISAAVDDI